MACDCPLGTVHRCWEWPTRSVREATGAADKIRQAAQEAIEAYERYLESVR